MKNLISRRKWLNSNGLFFLILSFFFVLSILLSFEVSAVSSGLIKADNSPTVYYLSSDGYRYTFPSQEIFYSWYSNFNSVKVLSSSVVNSYTIAGYVNKKPDGSAATDPRAYVTNTISMTTSLSSSTTTNLTTSIKSVTTTSTVSTTLTMLTKQGRINIQKALNRVLIPSPNLVTDGVIGTKTREAVKLFQSLMGLTVDGKIGQQTLTALNNAITNGVTLNTSGLVSYTTSSQSSQVGMTFPDGCFSTSGYSITTGLPCSSNITNNTSSLPDGCFSTSGYSITTGLSCSVIDNSVNPIITTTTNYTTTSSSGSGGGGGGGGSSGSSDRTIPVISSFSVPNIVYSLVVPIISFVATDNVGVTGYMLTTDSSTPKSTSSSWSKVVPTSYTFSSAGSKKLYAWVKDAGKNISKSVETDFIIDTNTITLPDTTAPTVTAFVIPSTATSLTVSVSSFTATDNTAVTGYLLTETSSAPNASSGSWTASTPTSYTFSTAGSKTLYAWAKDVAGNVSTSRNDSVTITLPDTTAPTVTAFVIPATSTSLTIPITTFTATDNTAVTGYLLTETSSVPSLNNSSWTSSAPTSYTFGSILGVSKYNFTQTLKKGITSEEVKQLQKFLNDHGYFISNTGAGSVGNETTYFGDLTKQAVMKFQQTNGLVADGIVGQNTRSILNK